MQFESNTGIFDTAQFTVAYPFSPVGKLFTYVPSEKPEALHFHDFLDLGYCESGSGLFSVDVEVHPFEGPCCSIIYGGQIHIAQSLPHQGNDWHFLYVDLQKLFSRTESLPVELTALSPDAYDFPSIIPHRDDPKLYQLCVSIMDEAANLRSGYLVAIRGMVTALLALHSRTMKPSSQIRMRSAPLIKRLGKVLIFINQHYMEELSVPQLVEVSGMSKSTLQRDMIQLTGLSPLKYLHNLRMRRAAMLLSNDSTSIASVAYEVGYSTLSSFNRHFLDAYHVSPSKWRNAQGLTSELAAAEGENK